MPQRTRIVWMGPGDPPAIPPEWAHAVLVVQAAGPEDALRLLSERQAHGLLSFPDGLGGPLPTGQELLDELDEGIAVVGPSLELRWCNRAFAALCVKPPLVGVPLDFAVTGTAGGGSLSVGTRRRLATHAGRELDLVLKALGDTPDAGLLATLRDVTTDQREREKLAAIHSAGRELAHLTAEELARMSTEERVGLLKANIVQYAQRILNFRNLEIRLLDPGSRRLRVLLSEGITLPPRDRDLLAEPVGNGVTGYVAATGKSYRADDVTRDPLYLPGAPNARSSLTVPIFRRDRLIGTFNVESPEPGHFTDRDQVFLETFAAEVGDALNALELLRAEQGLGRSATADALVQDVSLPADQLLSDAVRALDALAGPAPQVEAAKEALLRLRDNARRVKAAIHARAKRGEGLPDLTGRRVLYADEDADIRREVHVMLAPLGVEVDTAASGREAVALATALPYDVALGDIRLPDMTGIEFFRAIRQAQPTAAVVLVTGFGYDPHHSLPLARGEGLRSDLYKPFRVERLSEAIARALGSEPPPAPRVEI